ncbi:MAG: ABC transporter permease [Lachnospiraceae bacterium]|nr:ABC transporter permease [Lachnospiraceae bacterium]
MRRLSALKIKEKCVLTAPYLVWMGGFIVIPLLLILYYAFTTKGGAFTFSNVAEILRWENYKPLFLALLLSLASTVFCFILAFPLALVLRNKKIGRGSFVAFIFILPMWMNSLLRVLAWQTLLERKGVLNEILTCLHLPEQHLINTPYAIILGMVYDFLPFMILPIYNTLSKIDDNTINAAYDLGASFFTTLWKVILPLSIPGIVSGVTMVFVPALTTFAISNILGGGKIYLIGNVIEQEFTQNSNWNVGSGLSMILMVFIILSMAVLSRYDTGEGAMF